MTGSQLVFSTPLPFERSRFAWTPNSKHSFNFPSPHGQKATSVSVTNQYLIINYWHEHVSGCGHATSPRHSSTAQHQQHTQNAAATVFIALSTISPTCAWRYTSTWTTSKLKRHQDATWQPRNTKIFPPCKRLIYFPRSSPSQGILYYFKALFSGTNFASHYF